MVCTDKTGILTLNLMGVENLWVMDERFNKVPLFLFPLVVCTYCMTFEGHTILSLIAHHPWYVCVTLRDCLAVSVGGVHCGEQKNHQE